ncbi:hypothetical protein MA16_Dca016360 [Dendrobium catenatum]|uniref:Uncharacterized protein n=1 Tax=Dendrobium catenatum TaxID=906689 RepID=A0A2I0W339_9ASPA|nr:hypothetical protein MA16_Dca016360 [Dendrobium catenatum]
METRVVRLRRREGSGGVRLESSGKNRGIGREQKSCIIFEESKRLKEMFRLLFNDAKEYDSTVFLQESRERPLSAPFCRGSSGISRLDRIPPFGDEHPSSVLFCITAALDVRRWRVYQVGRAATMGWQGQLGRDLRIPTSEKAVIEALNLESRLPVAVDIDGAEAYEIQGKAINLSCSSISVCSIIACPSLSLSRGAFL